MTTNLATAMRQTSNAMFCFKNFTFTPVGREIENSLRVRREKKV